MHSIEYKPNVPLKEVEKTYILQSLKFHRGCKHSAARDLGVSVKTIYNKLNEYKSNEVKNVPNYR